MNRARNEAGITLLELLIVVVIVAILAVTAAQIYTRYITRSRRVDAIQTLMSMQLAQENYRANNSQYGSLAQVWGGVSTTSNGYYNLSVTNTSATGYTLTAQATSTQTSDTENGTACSSLVLTMSSGTETKTPTACWLGK